MNVEIGNETPIFLFWEYLFQIFGILSLQCSEAKNKDHKFSMRNKFTITFLIKKVLVTNGFTFYLGLRNVLHTRIIFIFKVKYYTI
jgi:hypothetical protein